MRKSLRRRKILGAVQCIAGQKKDKMVLLYKKKNGRAREEEQKTGIVQLLIFQQWALLMGRAKPVEPALCKDVRRDGSPHIMQQVKRGIDLMNDESMELFEIYLQVKTLKFFDNRKSNTADSVGPYFTLSDTNEKENIVEAYQFFKYMKSAIKNITEHQGTLNPKERRLTSKLNDSIDRISSAISNLSVILCERYKELPEPVMYNPVTASSTNGEFEKKTMGWRILKKYKNFLAQLAIISKLWSDDILEPFTINR
ncbi:leukemia inhibitory factor [Gastrophryne carolinensis]